MIMKQYLSLRERERERGLETERKHHPYRLVPSLLLISVQKSKALHLIDHLISERIQLREKCPLCYRVRSSHTAQYNNLHTEKGQTEDPEGSSGRPLSPRKQMSTSRFPYEPLKCPLCFHYEHWMTVMFIKTHLNISIMTSGNDSKALSIYYHTVSVIIFSRYIEPNIALQANLRCLVFMWFCCVFSHFLTTSRQTLTHSQE